MFANMKKRELEKNLKNLDDNTIDEVVKFNEKLVKGRGENFSVNKERIAKFVEKVHSADSIKNKKERVTKKASAILAGISWEQPFSDGNKETSLALARSFLDKNGYKLEINSKKEEKELYNLLVKTVYKYEDDPTIYNEVEKYISTKIVKK